MMMMMMHRILKRGQAQRAHCFWDARMQTLHRRHVKLYNSSWIESNVLYRWNTGNMGKESKWLNSCHSICGSNACIHSFSMCFSTHSLSLLHINTHTHIHTMHIAQTLIHVPAWSTNLMLVRCCFVFFSSLPFFLNAFSPISLFHRLYYHRFSFWSLLSNDLLLLVAKSVHMLKRNHTIWLDKRIERDRMHNNNKIRSIESNKRKITILKRRLSEREWKKKRL